MATDARFSTNLVSHPKTKKLLRRLGPAGGWAWVCLVLWTAANRSDGDLSGMSDEDIELSADWDGEEGALVRELVAIRFMDGEEGSRCLHDWAEHNPWAAGSKRRSEVAKENAAKKWGINGEEGADELTNAQKRSARLAEARRKGTHTQEEWEAMKWACGYMCVQCRATDRDLSKDHILAIVKGGSDAIDNIQPMCHRCNASKGANGEDKRPANWREMLAERLQNVCSSPSPSPAPTQVAAPAPLAPVPKPVKRKPIKTAMPEDFGISERVRAWAAEKGHGRLSDHLESFRSKCIAKAYTYADWDEAFMSAIRDDWAKLRSQPQQFHGGSGPPPLTVASDAAARTAAEIARQDEHARQATKPPAEVRAKLAEVTKQLRTA